MFLDKGVYDQHSTDPNSKTILRQRLGFIYDELGFLCWDKGVWVLASGSQKEVQEMIMR